MLWAPQIPRISKDGAEVTIIAGGDTTLPTPPHSWAADPANDVAIWSIVLQPGASWTLPPAKDGTNRVLYFFRGKHATIAGRKIDNRNGVQLEPTAAVAITNGPVEAELLLLQGRPIDEPVAQHGPFVMNTQQEIRQAFADYQRTRFGGWPWESDDPVHPRETGRFAKHADGAVERLVNGAVERSAVAAK